jgi:predicted ATPase
MTLDEARVHVCHSGERWYEAELLRAEAELLQASGDLAAAEDRLRRAIEVARDQEARLWELRSAMALARLWAEKGELHNGIHLLSPIYSWFTEGFDTPDLQEAKTLLVEPKAGA